MRMLRSNPDMPQFRILKSFSLFILGDTVGELINEAKQELVRGLIDWKEKEEPHLNVQAFIIHFKNTVATHVNYDVEEHFVISKITIMHFTMPHGQANSIKIF